MTGEEKQAIQMLLIDELQRNQQQHPTMLVDALLADQGFAWLHHVLSKRANEAQQALQATTTLLKAVVQPKLVEPKEEVA